VPDEEGGRGGRGGRGGGEASGGTSTSAGCKETQTKQEKRPRVFLTITLASISFRSFFCFLPS